MEMNIYIYEVRKDNVVSYEYINSKEKTITSKDVYLLFYDNHYDLF